MNKYFALFQLMRKNGTSQSYSISPKNKVMTSIRNFTGMKFFSIIFYALSFILALLIIFNIMGNTNEEGFFSILMSVSIMGFFFQLMFAISIGFYVYYLNNDLEYYLVLPITKNQLLLTRLIYNLYYSYYFTFVTIIPLLLWYIAKFGLSIYSLSSLIVGSLLSITSSTILPIVIIFLFISVFKFLKNKNSITYLFYILIFILSFGFNFAFRGLLGKIVTNSMDANYHITDFIVNSAMIIKTLKYNSLMPMLILILTAIIVIGVYLIFGNLFYIKNATKLSESASKKKAINYNKIKVKKESIVKTLLVREFKGIIRSPHKVFQFLFGPAILVIMAIGGLVVGIITSGASFDQIMSGINLGVSYLPKFSIETFGNDYSLLLMVFIGIILSMFQITFAANASSISIEGELGITAIKTWPIKFSKVLLAKVLVAPIINLFTNILFIIAGLILINNKLYILLVIVSFLISNYLVGWYGLTINILFPKFQWNNEMQVIKNSLSVFICSLTIFPYGFLVFKSLESGNIYITGLAISSIAILGFIGMCYCLVFSERILKKLNNK